MVGANILFLVLFDGFDWKPYRFPVVTVRASTRKCVIFDSKAVGFAYNDIKLPNVATFFLSDTFLRNEVLLFFYSDG